MLNISIITKVANHLLLIKCLCVMCYSKYWRWTQIMFQDIGEIIQDIKHYVLTAEHDLYLCASTLFQANYIIVNTKCSFSLLALPVCNDSIRCSRNRHTFINMFGWLLPRYVSLYISRRLYSDTQIRRCLIANNMSFKTIVKRWNANIMFSKNVAISSVFTIICHCLCYK